MVGVGQQVVHHGQLRHHLRQGVVPAAGGHGVDDGEAHEAHDHHAEQLLPMVRHEAESGGIQRAAILKLQAVGAEEEKHGHAIVAEERHEVGRQQPVGRRHDGRQPVYVVLRERVFVLLHHRTEPVAVVVEENADDGQAAQGGALRTGEQGFIHGCCGFARRGVARRSLRCSLISWGAARHSRARAGCSCRGSLSSRCRPATPACVAGRRS